MPRKKVSTSENIVPAAADLDDDEQLVVENTTKRTIRREKVPAPVAAGDADADDLTAGDDEAIDVDDDGEPIDVDAPAYGNDSLAAILFDEADGDDVENTFCTVHVRRNPDAMGDRFTLPCTDVMHLPRIPNVPISTSRADIHERVMREHGSGGHYFFQLHYNGQLGRSWRATLADLPEQRRGETAAEPVRAVPESAVPVNPIDAFLDNIEKQKRMRDLLFGDEQRRFDQAIAELRAENAALKAASENATPPPPQSEQLLILEKALTAGNPELTDRLLDYAFPSSDEGKRHWIAELADVAIKNREVIGGLLGSLLGGGATPAAAPAPQPTVADMLRQQPPPSALPPTEPPPGASAFRRKAAETPPVPETAEQIAEQIADTDAPPPEPSEASERGHLARPADDSDTVAETTNGEAAPKPNARSKRAAK